MKKFGMKSVTFYAIVALFIALALMPMIKAAMPGLFMEGFRDVDCVGVTCPEGKFCQSNKCIDIATRYPNAVPGGNE